MELVSEEVIRELETIDSIELVENMIEFPENERDGLSDFQILYDEICYLIDLYQDSGTVHTDMLKKARAIKKRTKDWKVIPVSIEDFHPLYKESEIVDARNLIEEYDRICSARKRVAKYL